MELYLDLKLFIYKRNNCLVSRQSPIVMLLVTFNEMAELLVPCTISELLVEYYLSFGKNLVDLYILFLFGAEDKHLFWKGILLKTAFQIQCFI